MLRLHRFPHHTYQIVAQGLEVCLVPELGREGFQGLPRVVLTALEASIYERLNSSPQGAEQSGDCQRGGHDRKLGLLTREGAYEPLKYHYAAHVHRHQRCRERYVYEGTVYDAVYLVEPKAHYRYPYGSGKAYESDYENDKSGRPQPSCAYRFGDGVSENATDGRHHHRVGRPLDLLTLYPSRPAQPPKHGRRPNEYENEHERL